MTPIPATAFRPKKETHRLVFEPEKGWHTAVWFEGRWVDALRLSIELHPSHIMEALPDSDVDPKARGRARLRAGR
jgi:hypothetical protein